MANMTGNFLIDILIHLFMFSLNKSMSILIFILAVLLVRILFRRMPKKYMCILWILVFIRLSIPGTLISDHSLNPFYEDTLYYGRVFYENEGELKDVYTFRMDSSMERLNQQMNRMFYDYHQQKDQLADAESEIGVIEEAQSLQNDHESQVTPLIRVFGILSFLWIFGIAVILIYSAVRIVILKKKIQTATCVKQYEKVKISNPKMQERLDKKKFRIYESDQIESPFLFGFFKPVIYLPLHFFEDQNNGNGRLSDSFHQKDRNFVILHEQMHIMRLDYIIKPILFIITCLYWYHPLVWLSFFLFSKDVEMAVDETVCRYMDQDARADYAKTLLKLSIKQSGLYLPLAFGESNTKARIGHVLSFSRGGKWITAAAVVVIVIVCICFGSVSTGRQSDNSLEEDTLAEGNDTVDLYENLAADKDDKNSQSDFIKSQDEETQESPDVMTENEETQEFLDVMIYHISKSSRVIEQFEISYGDLNYEEIALGMDCEYYFIKEDFSYDQTDFDTFSSFINDYGSIGMMCRLSVRDGVVDRVEATEPNSLIEEIFDEIDEFPAITYYEDLTHDGVDERIVVNPYYAVHMPRTGMEQIVQVYSGTTDQLIWYGHADYVHTGWSGFYIFEDETGSYLLNWEPEMWQGAATYTYRIFSLTETGAEREFLSEEISFDMNRPESCDPDAIIAYIEQLNEYLRRSYVLIDTNDGIQLYSEDGSKLTHEYDDSNIETIKELQTMDE